MSQNNVVGIVVGGVLLGAALGAGGVLAVKGRSKTPASSAASTCSVGGSEADGLFEAAGKAVGTTDLPAEARDMLFQLRQQNYDQTSGYLKEWALRVQLAQDQKLDTADLSKLPDLRSLLSMPKVQDADLKKFFEANQRNLPKGMTFEQVRPQLEQYLNQQKVAEASQAKLAEYVAAGKIKILLTPPVAPLVNVPVDGFPSQGNVQSQNVVVEVSDYLCPHCRSARLETMDFVKKNSDSVRFVQINFALQPSGVSGALVRGGFCAFKQGEQDFWKYHEAAFVLPPEAAQGNPSDVAKGVAKTAGLREADFANCLASDEAKNFVDQTNAKMTAVGVTGTPTFFLNNRKVTATAGQSIGAALGAALLAQGR